MQGPYENSLFQKFFWENSFLKDAYFKQSLFSKKNLKDDNFEKRNYKLHYWLLSSGSISFSSLIFLSAIGVFTTSKFFCKLMLGSCRLVFERSHFQDLWKIRSTEPIFWSEQNSFIFWFYRTWFWDLYTEEN